MSQATFHSTGATASTNATTNEIVVNSPAATSVGDLLIAIMAGNTPFTPAGWAPGPKNTAGSFPLYVFWKWASAPGAQSTTFTLATYISYAHAAIVAVSGLNNVGDPVSASAVSDTTLTVPSMTSTRAGGLLLTAHSSNSSPYAPPTGMAEIASVVNPVMSPGPGFEVNVLTVGTSPTGTKVPSSVPPFTGDGCSLGLVVSQDNVAPNAPTLTAPPNNGTIDRNVTQRFVAPINDPGDSQSALTIWDRQGAGAWTTTVDTTPNPFHDFPPGTLALGLHEWQAANTDQGSPALTGPRSASNWYTAADSPGVPAITAPTSGSTIGLATGSITWSVTAQTDFQVRKVADLAGAADPGTVYYDSGEVTSSATRTFALTFPVNNRWDHLQIRVKAAGLWSAWADCRVYVSWTAPMVPTVTATPYPLAAEILVVVTNPTPTGGAPATSYNDIYVSSALDPEYRAATWVPPNSGWPWKTPASGRAYTIRAVAVGANGTLASSLPADTVVLDGGTPSASPDLISDGGTP